MVHWLFVAALPWPTACSVAESFACNADAQCVTDEAAGRCEAEGVCSFPDESCPSGHRYGGLAGGLSGECVGGGSSSDVGTTDPDPGMTSVPPVESLDDGSSSGLSTSSTSSTSMTIDSTTEPPDSTSEPGVETATTTTTTTTDASSTGPGLGPDPYGPCTDGGDCEDADSYCILDNDASVCAPPCELDDDCPPSLEPASSVVCTDVGGPMGCVIFCDETEVCPAGMRCDPLVMMAFGYCAWG